MSQEDFERRNRRERQQHNIEVLGLQLLNSKEEFMTPKIYANNVLDEESDVGYIVLQAIHNARSLDIYDLMPDKTIIQVRRGAFSCPSRDEFLPIIGYEVARETANIRSL